MLDLCVGRLSLRKSTASWFVQEESSGENKCKLYCISLARLCAMVLGIVSAAGIESILPQGFPVSVIPLTVHTRFAGMFDVACMRAV